MLHHIGKHDLKETLLISEDASEMQSKGLAVSSVLTTVDQQAPQYLLHGRFVMEGCPHVTAGYGGGMSSAKAALESDTRVLAFEAGRKYGVRVNTISAGPLGSRAAKVRQFQLRSSCGKASSGSTGHYFVQAVPGLLLQGDVTNLAQAIYSPSCFFCRPLASLTT